MTHNLTSEQILEALRNELSYLEKKYQVQSLSLFGSYSRNNQTPESDIDILVTFSEIPGFIKFMQLENHLSDMLSLEVDLVMKDALKKNIGSRIKKRIYFGMSSTESFLDYLDDMLQAIEKAQQFINGMNIETFKNDEKTQFAVIRAIEIIGEASSKIPESVRDTYEHVPWREMKGMRNKLIHNYMGVNEKVVWKTIKQDLPDLKNSIKQ